MHPLRRCEDAGPHARGLGQLARGTDCDAEEGCRRQLVWVVPAPHAREAQPHSARVELAARRARLPALVPAGLSARGHLSLARDVDEDGMSMASAPAPTLDRLRALEADGAALAGRLHARLLVAALLPVLLAGAVAVPRPFAPVAFHPLPWGERLAAAHPRAKLQGSRPGLAAEGGRTTCSVAPAAAWPGHPGGRPQRRSATSNRPCPPSRRRPCRRTCRVRRQRTITCYAGS